MKLQLAMDVIGMEEAVRLVGTIADVIDIVEIGTPMIVKDGMLPVQAMKQAYPDVTVLADVKIAAGGSIEAGYAVEAGADIVTVLGIAADETIQGARDAAHKLGREVYVDMLSVEDVVGRAKELDEMGVDYIGVHTASDVQPSGKGPYEELQRIAAAGGISLATISDVRDMGADVGIVGSALMREKNLREAVIAYQAKIKG